MALWSARPLQQQHRHPRARITPTPARSLRRTRCSAVEVMPKTTAGIRWGSSKLQGRRSEMEDDVVVLPKAIEDFAFAAVFDGHAGFSSVEFLREELYQKCTSTLQDGLLSSKNFGAARDALVKAFNDVDEKLHIWLEETEKEADSGSTATLMFLRSDFLIVSHVGDSSVVISRGGSADTVTEPHRPYGRKGVSLGEIKRIKASGGWISDGRVCGDLAVSRAFGDFRFKTRKNEMLRNGVKDGRWTQKFISRIQFKGDLIIPTPDILQLDLGPDVEFIILATDGLWDYMKSSEVVAFVRNQLRQHGDAQMACEALAHTALDRKSEDNISIVIADLGRTDWKNLPSEAGNIFYELGQSLAVIGIVSLGIWITILLTA